MVNNYQPFQWFVIFLGVHTNQSQEGKNGKRKRKRKKERSSFWCVVSVTVDEWTYTLYRVLKSQNLSGTLPPELVRLPYLQEM